MAARVSSPTFVGRRRELDRAAAALARASEGNPAVLLIAGEAGVGKTRFVHEFMSRARGLGARVLEGGCVQIGSDGLPFGPLVEALRGLVYELPESELARLLGTGRAELSRLIPRLLLPGEEQQHLEMADGSGQGRLFEHVLLLLERLASSSPLVFLVEDIHWADRSTLELLTFLVRNLREGPIVLMATYRSDELHRQHPLAPFLIEQGRAGKAERIELNRFDRLELASQIEGILGVRPEPELVDRIANRSDGNAFYAEELLAARDQGPRLPDTLRDTLLARVATLSERGQDLVRVAAAGGTRVSPQLLRRVTGFEQSTIDAALREAVVRHVLRQPEDPADDGHAFRHALVQEAVYGELLIEERVHLHIAFAEALTSGGAPDTDASRAAEVAYHWDAAQDRSRAFDAWIRAGMAAEAIYAFPEAGAHFERALDLWNQVPDATSRAPIDRVELLVRAAAAIEATAVPRAITLLRTAIEFVDPAAQPTRAGLLNERLGQYTSHLSDAANALAAYREAVRLVPAEPPSAARALVLSGLGRCLFFLHRHEESAALCEQALRVAKAVGARAEESRALMWLGASLTSLGDVDRGIENLERAREIAAELGNAYLVSWALTLTTSVLVESGRYDRGVTAGFEADRYAVQHGLAARFGASDLGYAAEALIMLGRWDEATAALDRAQRYGGVAWDHVEEVASHLDALRGEFTSAARRLGRLPAVQILNHGFNVRPGLVELALWKEDLLAARKAVRDGTALFDAQPDLLVNDIGSACAFGIRAEADLAASARTRRSEPEARAAREVGAALLARMRSLTREVAARRPYFTPQAKAWLATCEAEFSRLERTSDPGRWAMAAAAWDALGLPYLKAYALMREGEAALTGRGDRHRAARALDEAGVIAVRLGAEPLRRAVQMLAAHVAAPRRSSAGRANKRIGEDLMRSGEGRPPTDGLGPRYVVARGRDDLTPREREVLELVAVGRSNSEIGQALFISKKTASVHVANIKAKLGAQSRVEIVTLGIGLSRVEVR